MVLDGLITTIILIVVREVIKNCSPINLAKAYKIYQEARALKGKNDRAKRKKR